MPVTAGDFKSPVSTSSTTRAPGKPYRAPDAHVNSAGPGTVYLQSLPFSRLADRIGAAARFGKGKGEVKRGGDLIGSLLGGK